MSKCQGLTQAGQHCGLQPVCEVDGGAIEPQELAQLALGAAAVHGSSEAGGQGGGQRPQHLEQQDSHHLVGVLENL